LSDKHTGRVNSDTAPSHQEAENGYSGLALVGTSSQLFNVTRDTPLFVAEAPPSHHEANNPNASAMAD